MLSSFIPRVLRTCHIFIGSRLKALGCEQNQSFWHHGVMFVVCWRHPSLTDTRADPCENILLCSCQVTKEKARAQVNQGNSLPWIYGSPYSLSCGGQVPDVGVPHYRDARMQHRPVQCPSTLHSGQLCAPLQPKLREGACADPGPRQCPHPPHRGHRTKWGDGLPTMHTAAYLVAEGISQTTGPGREGKENAQVS